MAPPTNKLQIATGIFTLVQAAVQAMFAAFSIAQYFCIVDFLRRYPLLVLIRILYFNNPGRCGTRINIGQVYDDMVDQAFVFVTRQPFSTHRTFVINSISLGLSVLWIVGSLLLIKGGARRHRSNHTHWPWLVITLLITLLDFVALIVFANDSFHTKTLDDMLTYVSGTPSGVGNVKVDTLWVSWSMVILYSRFGIFIIANVTLMICGVVDCTRTRSSVTSSEVDRNRDDGLGDIEVLETSPAGEAAVGAIPRPGINRAFRAMKNFLFNGASEQPASLNEGRNRHRGVNFSEDIELPTFESMINEQRRRLNASVVDTSGRRSLGHGSRSPALAHSLFNLPDTSTGLRGRAAELQSQMPWAYIPASSYRMRDQLPPDEDLPPVPLPDYTAFQSARKASVHRAASSLSSMTQKKDYTSYQSPHQQPAQGTARRLPAPEPVQAQVQVASAEPPFQEASDEESVYSLVTMGRPECWVPSPPPPPARRGPLPPMPPMPSPPFRLLPPPNPGDLVSPLSSKVGSCVCAFLLAVIGLYSMFCVIMSIMRH